MQAHTVFFFSRLFYSDEEIILDLSCNFMTCTVKSQTDFMHKYRSHNLFYILSLYLYANMCFEPCDPI